MSESSTPNPIERRPLRDQYIVSPLFDWIFFLGSPLLAVGVIFGAVSFIPDRSVSNAVLLFMAVGHHVPTMIRAYADPDEFRTNRYRLVAVPAVLIPLILWMGLIDSKLLYLVFIWDQYHFVRQHYGFMRLYDLRNGSLVKSIVNLDQWLCFALFAAIVTHSDFYAYLYSIRFYEMVGPLPSWVGTTLREGSLLAAGGVGAAWLVDVLRRRIAGQPIAVLKLALFATTYGVWWYAYTLLSDPLLSYAISSLFHCLQYDALAWHYNRRKAATLPIEPSAQVFRYLHEARHLWLYVGAILSYGLVSWWGGLVAPTTIFVINRTTGLLHYYYDSFIWRVRRPDIRRSLA